MSNMEKYIEAFTLCFGVDATMAKNLTMHGIPAWDSVGHMGLVAQIEAAFEIQFDPDDMLDLKSFAAGQKILTEKYNIDFEK